MEFCSQRLVFLSISVSFVFISNDAKIAQKRKTKQQPFMQTNKWWYVTSSIVYMHFFAFLHSFATHWLRTTILTIDSVWIFDSFPLSTEDSKPFLYSKFKIWIGVYIRRFFFNDIIIIIIQNYKYPIAIHIKPSGPSHSEYV